MIKKEKTVEEKQSIKDYNKLYYYSRQYDIPLDELIKYKDNLRAYMRAKKYEEFVKENKYLIVKQI